MKIGDVVRRTRQVQQEDIELFATMTGDRNPVRAVTVRVAPVPMICADRVDPSRTQGVWPLAQPLFVALDLAQDPGRGREVLAGWTPPKDLGRRVW